MTVYLEPNEQLTTLARRLYPDYVGRKYRAVPCERVELDSHWEGGTREYFTVLRGIQSERIGQTGTPFDCPAPTVELDRETVVVSHKYFCGHDMGITLYLHPSLMPALLPEPGTELTWAERVVLCAVGSLKSSYGGEPNFRMNEAMRKTGITADEYERAKAALILSGHLNRAGAITVSGRNARGNTDFWQLKRS